MPRFTGGNLHLIGRDRLSGRHRRPLRHGRGVLLHRNPRQGSAPSGVKLGKITMPWRMTLGQQAGPCCASSVHRLLRRRPAGRRGLARARSWPIWRKRRLGQGQGQLRQGQPARRRGAGGRQQRRRRRRAGADADAGGAGIGHHGGAAGAADDAEHHARAAALRRPAGRGLGPDRLAASSPTSCCW